MFFVGRRIGGILGRLESGKIEQHILTKEETQEMFDKIPKESLHKE